jgi:glycosyltransferase involved in cell wall biosynthesis
MSAICVIGPGGAEGHGGIGRHIHYVTRRWESLPGAASLRVMDSYGRAPYAMPATFLRCLGSLALQLLRGQVELVHLHMASKGSVARKLSLLHLAKLARVRVVLHLHGSTFAAFYDALPPPARWLIGASMRRADTVIALGTFWQEFLSRRVGIDPARIVLMPNAVAAGIDPARVPHDGRCHLLFLGRIGARKGTGDLLKALAALPAALAGAWELTCAGDGDVAEHAALAARLGLAARVRFTGWVDEAAVQGLLAQSDVMVLPSYHEGLPMAILEAMAQALPVISTPVGAIGDVVCDRRNGLLVPPGDVPALAAALICLITRPELRLAMGRAGRLDVVRTYGLDAYCERLGRLYCDLGV